MVEQGGEKAAGSGGPRSAIRVMDILRELAHAPNGLPLTRIYSSLELPKTSTYSLLKALEHGGFIAQIDGGYRLGPEAFRLGAAIAQQRRFPEFVRPVIENLARETGETILLGVLDENGQEIKYVDVVESPQPLRFILKVGDRRPLYSSTTGKILLAYFDDERLRNYLDSVERVQFTKRTLTGEEELLADIARIRSQGWAENVDGTTEGITSYGAPVFEDDRRLIAVIVVAGPGARMSARARNLRALVVKAGEDMSRLLNCIQPYPPQDVEEIGTQ